MYTVYSVGVKHALVKLGLDTQAKQLNVGALKQLANPSLLERLESYVVPSAAPAAPHPYEPVHAAELDYLKNTYGVQPTLTGSMPLNLHVPGEVDLDYFINEQDPEKFRGVVQRLQQDPRYKSSPFNVPDANYYVFQRSAQSDTDYPVDLAIATGDPAAKFLENISVKAQNAASIPDSLRQKLVDRKRVLKNTPFDVGHARYKAFKLKLDKALGIPSKELRLKRMPLDAAAAPKTAAITNLQDPEELRAFTEFVNAPDMYGHSTHNIESVLDRGALTSALQALREGKLKSYERGSEQGSHTEVPYSDLLPEHLQHLEQSILTHAPDVRAYDRIAQATGKSVDEIKMDFIRQNYDKIHDFVNAQPDPETFRQAYLSVPKLGPSIFVNKGGIMDTDAYGDTSVLFRTPHAIPSPHMNLVPDEHIIPQINPFESREVPLQGSYILAPKEKIQGFEAKHPEYKYVAREDIPSSLKSQFMKSPVSITEPITRWIPNMIAGTFTPSETK